jgi:hypothetical protein
MEKPKRLERRNQRGRPLQGSSYRYPRTFTFAQDTWEEFCIYANARSINKSAFLEKILLEYLEKENAK